nr:MAG TPA: hypothetical protein [Bacteriophage sp.]
MIFYRGYVFNFFKIIFTLLYVFINYICKIFSFICIILIIIYIFRYFL